MNTKRVHLIKAVRFMGEMLESTVLRTSWHHGKFCVCFFNASVLGFACNNNMGDAKNNVKSNVTKLVNSRRVLQYLLTTSS